MQGATFFCHLGTSNRIHDRKQTMGSASSIYSPLAAYSPTDSYGCLAPSPPQPSIHVTLPFREPKVETVDLARNNARLWWYCAVKKVNFQELECWLERVVTAPTT